ncbi:MAG: hypothetical protein JWL84_5342 [Rhodospirillales bacterium]|jgi:hypothetical protein|nr:hypothetical protein [Rhodospirillales bacterium]
MFRKDKSREKLQCVSSGKSDTLAAATQEIARLYTLLGDLRQTMHPERNLPEEVTDPIFARIESLESIIRITRADTPSDTAVMPGMALATDLESGVADLTAVAGLPPSRR